MKFKLYKNKFLIILILLFIFIIIIHNLTIKEGKTNRSRSSPPPPPPPPPPRRPLCYNCTYYNSWTRRCESYCGENQTCSRGRCICNADYHMANSRCEKCPNGQYWNGWACVCPDGQHWNGSICKTCVQGQEWRDNDCRCKPYQALKADGSSCIDKCEKTSVWNGNQCVCPEGTKWIVTPTDSGCK